MTFNLIAKPEEECQYESTYPKRARLGPSPFRTCQEDFALCSKPDVAHCMQPVESQDC